MLRIAYMVFCHRTSADPRGRRQRTFEPVLGPPYLVHDSRISSPYN